MAAGTNPELQNQVIYSVYIRNHTPEGSFLSLVPDLDRIRDLGTDIIWLMPIHPIGVKGRKGSLGSPYANRDYRTVNPEYGSLEDFKTLVREIHHRGMKCIIDVVYNHTSPDSVLFEQHPDWFYKRPDGSPGNQVGDWTDVIDLDYSNRALWDYQIDSLCLWAETVDGFRCDVASFVPVDFWLKARAAVEKVRPGCIWLAESVHLSFGSWARRSGLYCARDTELFSAFDMEYEYDIWESFERYLKGSIPLSAFMDMLNFQEALYPANYNKLRFLENHDQPRIASVLPDQEALVNLTAMLYFLKGTTLLYAGQEFCDDHLPSLFDKDVFNRNTGRNISALLSRLREIKGGFGSGDSFMASADDDLDIAVMERESEGRYSLGVFSLKGKKGPAAVKLADGEYTNLIDGSTVSIRDGSFFCQGSPVIITVEA